MAWTLTATNGLSVTFNANELTVSDTLLFNQWVVKQAGTVEWSPTGPYIPVPPTTEAQAFVLAMVFIRDTGLASVISGDPPDVDALLYPDGLDGVY